jgi:hypothetical protein
VTDTTNYNYGYPVEAPKITTIKTAEGAYNEPGLPKPPAGYGKVIGFVDSVDGDDMGPESRDEN